MHHRREKQLSVAGIDLGKLFSYTLAPLALGQTNGGRMGEDREVSVQIKRHEEETRITEVLKGGFFLLSFQQLTPSSSPVLNCPRTCGSRYKFWELPRKCYISENAATFLPMP